MSTKAEQLSILQHTLGLDAHGRGRAYRNSYVVGPGCDGYERCRELVELGLMVEHRGSELSGGSPVFRATAAGEAWVRSESPPPPRLTRSQQRYRRYLDADSSFKFGEWLKLERFRKAEGRR